MRVLITGGAGFIGGHAVQHFVSCGDEVLNVDNLTYAADKKNIDRSNFIKADIADRELFQKITKEFSPDFIVNFAAETHVDNSILSYEEFLHSNVIGTASVVSTCKNLGIKLCHISTDEVYGPASDVSFTEDDRLNPMNPYSASKAAGDLFVKSFHNTHKTPYVIVRPSNNYGPRQHEEKFIPKLLKCLQEGNKFPLYGDGNQVREWTYVKDTVAIIRKILLNEDAWCSTYNLTSEVSMTNRQVIEATLEIINKKHGKNHKFEDVIQAVEDRKGHDRKYFISPVLLHNRIQHSYKKFVEGLEEILNEQ